MIGKSLPDGQTATHHLLEKMAARGAGGYRDPDFLGQLLGLLGGAEECVDGGRGIEIRTTVGVDDALGPGRGARGEGDRDHVVLAGALRLQTSPALGTLSAVILQAFEDSIVKGPTQLALGSVRVGVDEEVHAGMGLFEVIEEMGKLGVDDDGVDLSKVKDVVDVIGLQSVIDGDIDAASGCNAEDGLEKGWCVGGQDADATEAMLDEVVRQTTSAVGKLAVGPTKGLAIGRHVKDGFSIRLNGGSALEKEGGRELVDVIVVLVFGSRCGL
ncbi:hypothetical protein BN1708_005159 [Verticillium longisporum]|uniref:Uncharacterized protein n=1 Tax=Verticillium longisporum TaxID=100787 RepID=A0A0G4M891_VERLO|nr:hypothetical protein BN1708_005159 [Verticillium longisporum]